MSFAEYVAMKQLFLELSAKNSEILG